jgi:hypothetical protein
MKHFTRQSLIRKYGLAFAGCFLLFVSHAHAGLVGAEPVARTFAIRTVADGVAELEKSLASVDGNLLVLAQRNVTREFILPVVRSGKARRVDVVLPFAKDPSDSEVDEIRANLVRNGITDMDAMTLKNSKGIISGFIGKVPIRFMSLPRIPDMGEDKVAVLVDPAFILASYRDETRTPVTELARKLVLTLRDRHVRADDVFMIEPDSLDDITMRYGFMGSLLKDMLLHPEAYKENLPERWRLLQEAEYAQSYAQYPDALRLYREYLKAVPDDASACYKIAMMAARDLDEKMALQWANNADRIDPRYARAYLEIADFFEKKGMADLTENFIVAALSNHPTDTRLASTLAAFYLTQGKRAQSGGDSEAATEYFTLAAEVNGADPSIREMAGKLARGEGRKPGPPVPR